jgi:N-methylhydantoinase A
VLVNAYTTPPLRAYLHRLSGRLEANGFDTERLLIMQSHGGVVAADLAAERGVSAVRSGPAGGVVAAAHVGRLCGADDLIGIDMGGTSYDVSLIHKGIPQVRQDTWVSRYRVAVPMLDIHAIGAGGGSIASLDQVGTLHVGPQSAGAVPGPACYGRGGRLPTVTDADVVLGYLDPESFLGGRLRLDPRLSRTAIEEHVSRALGWDVEEAAIGIVRVVNNNMNNGVRYVSIARGHDPRDFALVAFGGAGAVHACMQAHDLHISRVLVPRDASVFCALGAAISDLRVSLTHPFFARGARLDLGTLNDVVSALRERATVTLRRSAQSLRETREYRFLNARYLGQAHEVTVPVESANGSLGADDLDAALARFHDLHEALYAFKNPEQQIEVLNVRYELVGVRTKPETPPQLLEESVDPATAYSASRPVHFEVDGRFRRFETPVFAGPRLQPGNVVTGPAVIQEPYTTLVVCPGQRARLNEHLVYAVETGAAA